MTTALDRHAWGGCCPLPMLPGGSFRPCLLGGSSPVGSVGPDGTLNKVLGHSVLDHADPPDRHVFAQEVLEPLEHSVLDAAGPAVAVGPVGPLRTLSPSDCHPAGPYVAGGPVGPDGTLEKVLEPLEHSVLDHADPAGQHAFIHEVLEPLEHSVLDHAGPAGQHVAVDR